MNRTRSSRRHSDFCFLVGLLLPALSLLAQTESPRQLVERGKGEFKIAAYKASLATFDRLDALSRQPAFEAERPKLLPLIAFYRGANHAALREDDAAEREFRIYLQAFPNASIDPAAFPPLVTRCFERARQRPADRAAGKSSSDEASGRGMADAYARFRTADRRPAPVNTDDWARGTVRYLFMKGELDAWSNLADPVSRAEFITQFWQRRDPNPQTPENEFREEYEKRVQFADAMFTTGEVKGSDTDRGLVLILLGPPSYATQIPLKSDDDPVQAARSRPVARYVPGPAGQTSVEYEERNPMTAEVIQGVREVWHYRRDRLPKSVRFNEVDFEFVTKKGYGDSVLQRDNRVLAALDDARGEGRPAAAK